MTEVIAQNNMFNIVTILINTAFKRNYVPLQFGMFTTLSKFALVCKVV